MAEIIENQNQVGKPDSWADMVAVVESDKLQFTSMVGKRMKPSQVVHKWQVKHYKKIGHTGVVDNRDIQNFTGNVRVEVDGVCQKTWDGPAVSDFAEEAKVAGVPRGEMAEQVADAFVAVKRAIESRCLSVYDALRDNGADQGNETRGIFSWASPTAQTLYPVDATFRPPAAQQYSGALNAFSERTHFLPAMRSSWKQRKGPSNMVGFVGIDLKAKFTDFARYDDTTPTSEPVRMFTQNGDSKEYVNVIDRLVLDTGTVKLIPSAYLYTDKADGDESDYTHRSGVFLDMDMVGLAFTRNPRYRPIQDKGAGPRGIVDTIFMLMVDNPLPIVSVLSNSDN